MSICIKCGSSAITIRYQPRGGTNLKWYPKECLVKRCGICGYSWEEDCLDNKEHPRPADKDEKEE